MCRHKKFVGSLLFSFFCLFGTTEGKLKVATLHPLLTDLAQQVGGEHVEVISLLKLGQDPHAFDPTPSDLIRLQPAKLILASGKNLETYLHKLQDNLAEGQEIYEVGRLIPSLKIEEDSALFVCCPDHAHGAIDPHWWHSIENMQRAARLVAQEFARVDPDHAESYKQSAKNYAEELKQLLSWAKKEIAQIPRSQRKLATAHAAFGYFCKEFGFRAIPIQGLTREKESSPRYLGEVIATLKKEKVKAIFPEKLANPKVLQAMVRETGVNVGGTLIADGTAFDKKASYEGMMRYNVQTIVEALR